MRRFLAATNVHCPDLAREPNPQILDPDVIRACSDGFDRSYPDAALGRPTEEVRSVDGVTGPGLRRRSGSGRPLRHIRGPQPGREAAAFVEAMRARVG